MRVLRFEDCGGINEAAGLGEDIAHWAISYE